MLQADQLPTLRQTKVAWLHEGVYHESESVCACLREEVLENLSYFVLVSTRSSQARDPVSAAATFALFVHG